MSATAISARNDEYLFLDEMGGKLIVEMSGYHFSCDSLAISHFFRRSSSLPTHDSILRMSPLAMAIFSSAVKSYSKHTSLRGSPMLLFGEGVHPEVLASSSGMRR